MKKSAMVALGVLAVAAGITGCQDDTKDVKTCVDRSGKVVDDKYCMAQPQTAGGQRPSARTKRHSCIRKWAGFHPSTR